jgi:hypothetical protein
MEMKNDFGKGDTVHSEIAPEFHNETLTADEIYLKDYTFLPSI